MVSTSTTSSTSHPTRTLPMKAMTLVLSAAALCAVSFTVTVDAAQAQARHGGGHYRGGGGHWHGGGGGAGWFWGGIGLGLGIGAINYYSRPWYPGYVVVEPPVTYYDVPPVAVVTSPAPAPSYAVPAAQTPPDPIIYPRNGQSAALTESDRRECNRWAMSQPRAMAEASIFHRATLACMEGRGYILK